MISARRQPSKNAVGEMVQESGSTAIDDANMMGQVESLVDACLTNPANDEDIAIVKHQLGRYPRGMVAVGARCGGCGQPLAVVTRPELPDGTPFPTTCYLTNPVAVRAVSHAEANGVMGEYNELLHVDDRVRDAYERAHRRYLIFRQFLAVRLGDDESRIASISAGGMPVRVKCLHALLAQALVMGMGVNPIGDLTLQRVHGEFDPRICRCTPVVLADTHTTCSIR